MTELEKNLETPSWGAAGGHEHSRAGCCCEHGHSHDHSHTGCGCEHGHNHDHSHTGCADGCGHDHTHGGGKIRPLELWLLAASVALAITGAVLGEGWLSAALLLGGILLAGWCVFVEGARAILRLRLDETALLLVAVAAAIALGEYAEAAIVTILFQAGQLLEGLAVSRSQNSIRSLVDLRPKTAHLVTAEGFVEAEAAQLPVGSRILIKPGERVPLDAVVLEGTGSLDTAALTGESEPRPAGPGSELLSGMVNLDGSLVCRTLRGFADSAASRIIALVEDSTANKGRTEQLITRFARIYTPAVVAAAVALAVLPPLLAAGAWSVWINRALVFLVASCPCALVIAIPLSYYAGIGAASRAGVLVKGSRFMELLAKPKNLLFDKTGTITAGRSQVSEVLALGGLAQAEVLRLAAMGERHSNHPAARAVLAAAGALGADTVSSVREFPGQGVAFQYDGAAWLCGGLRLLQSQGVDTAGLPEGSVYLARDGIPQGVIRLEDPPRPEARETIDALRRAGVRQIGILTGDRAAPAQLAAEACGVQTVYADLLPADKVARLAQFKKQGVTLFVGDGINDAPVLGLADVGIAMGLGSDAAIEAADVVLVAEGLSGLPAGIRIARRTCRTAHANMAFALAVKAAVLALGALGLAQMWMAVFADVGVTVLCVLFASRLLRRPRR